VPVRLYAAGSDGFCRGIGLAKRPTLRGSAAYQAPPKLHWPLFAVGPILCKEGILLFRTPYRVFRSKGRSRKQSTALSLRESQIWLTVPNLQDARLVRNSKEASSQSLGKLGVILEPANLLFHNDASARYIEQPQSRVLL